MDIVFLGQQNWDVCWTAKQQFATRLAERGHRILYVDPLPAEPEQAARLARTPENGLPGLRRVGPRELYVYTYVKIPALRWRVNRLRFFLTAPRVLRAVGFHAPVALCLHPVQLPWLKRAGARAWAYYAVDEYTAYHGMPETMKQEVRAAENELLDTAEVALAVSPTLHARFAERNPAAFLLENGADREHYHPDRLARIATHPAVADLAGAVVGLIGQVDNRIDQDLLIELARRQRDLTFVLAGRAFAANTAPLEAEPNIRLLGYQPYEVLPNIAKAVDVWLLPYVQTELTNACNPLKLYEYLATGKPVVATPLDGIRCTRDFVTLAKGADAFQAAIAAALADPERGRVERLGAAAANDWYERADRMEAFLELAVARARERGRHAAGALVPVSRLTPRHRDVFVSEHGEMFEPAFGRLQRLAQPVTRALGLPWYAARMAGRALQGRPDAVRRILVVRRGYLGDFIVLLPALAYLRRRYPEARIVLGVQHDMTSADLFRHGGTVDEVVPMDVLRQKGGRWKQLRGVGGLFARGFDLVIAGGLYNMLAEGHHTGAPRYVGLYDGYPDQEIQGRALRRDEFRHESENNLALVEALGGMPASEADRMAPLRLPEDEIAGAAAGLDARLGLPPGGRVVVVHPGSKRATRRWPMDRMAAVVTRLLAAHADVTVVLSGGGAERSLTAEVASGVPAALRGRLCDAAGQTGLLALVALLDRATVLLSNDTGVMHLARARGTPLVALMGPENDKVWGPAPLGRAPAVALRHIVPCAPCLRDDCAALYCMKGLQVDEVAAEVASLLAAGRPPAGGAAVPVVHRRRRAHWSDVAAAGHRIPLVTVAAAAEGGVDATLAALLPVVERQTYPKLELLVTAPAGEAAAWEDRRDPLRRAALPVRVAVTGDRAHRAVVAAEARGELIALAGTETRWPAAHVAVDVAAALRAPDVEVFRHGRPLPAVTGAGVTIRRDALIALTRPAAVPEALGDCVASGD